ncbi:PolC-type DNA polymerase III [Clostridium estertheticum]|uniref:DNA polymerase III PolC-type n=2 Tax=Clostridium estertheticum TaxID=238834 RepID=A0A1J0GI15_9CLOT|nr:PolC-type DNA polymerase III [Clostridium estertheticum]APC40919.1 PolC-type DNA polymerase III [Clostridium estertheticum subsp. estertheticum]MBU3073977.1 PolC-type DNA polymerase III [Clostridium estertheticum]MBU3164071.1 PolC-type DNA polymerase III [Clostridium estertheticum]MBZ9617217.1 PolC-type DNA polymerase III [Clostridium estertheticum subsp. laramiense]WAG72908.1 PolC-type DNA polymerase III [Clostridium estertheticum]
MNASLAQMLKNDLDLNEETLVDNIKVLRVQYLKKSNKLRVIIKSFEDTDDNKKLLIKEIISKRLCSFNDIQLICYHDVSNATIEDVKDKFWLDVVNVISISEPSSKDSLLKSTRIIENGILKIQCGNDFMCKILRDKNIELLMKNTINDMFGVNSVVKLEHNSELSKEDSFMKKEKENETIINEIVKNMNIEKTDKPRSGGQSNDNSNGYKANKFSRPGYKKGEVADKNTIMGRNINDESMEIKDISETSGIICACGDIFKVNIIETKTGRIIITFYITDYSSSITVKCFPKPKEVEKMMEEIKVGLYCKIRGEASYDTYAREVVVMARDIIKLKKIERMDTAQEKRVELHLHTQMSAMDGISPASKLVERAAKWGHSAVAITDHGVVQAFPEAMDAAKKNKIKVIYGVEGYLVDDGVPIVINNKGETLDDRFVVFDLETTGLSSENDKIIEIGALKIENGKIVDRFSEFVNPGIDIPYKIIELTGITNDNVSDAASIEDVLPKFLEFTKDSVLVAHNSDFDASFIKKNSQRLGLKFENAIMDTIPLAKYLLKDLKTFKLNTVAKYLGITLENHHRAVDDAKATADILLHCFGLLREKNILDLDTLNKEFLADFNVKKANTYHVIILVKNQIGLKNLYKLISFSNLEYFHRRPRLPKTLIEKYREGLIVGSACEAGQVYKEVLQGKSEEDINKIVKFYDYLEIQPLLNNKFMIKKGIVKDESELMDINRRICTIGDKNNMPVVATGDVHFLEPLDAVFRKILMAGKGFSDADDQPPLYFKTTNEMLSEFSYLGEKKCKEVVIYNPNKIAEMIEFVKPIPDGTFTPKIPGAEEDIRKMTSDKVHSIYGDPLPEIVEKRLEKELNSIIGNGYAVLYLIAEKLVAKSLADGYLVGSRGSVGSSFAANMSNITEVNGLPPHYICPNCKKSEFILDGSIGSGADLPDKECPDCGTLYKKDGFDIPFETFLGFEGDKEPDIDLNFSGDNQADIHRYTEVLFGKGHTFKAGTIGTIADKTAYGYVKKYLNEKDVMVPQAEIERLVQGCTGVKRTSGQHPGGIMVVPSDNEIYNFCPVQHPADDPTSDIITTHFDYHSISGRLLKLDILGHDDPTMLKMLQDLTGLDPLTIPLSDDNVISLFTSPKALGLTAQELGCEVGSYGVPEFGTKFVRQMLLDTQPKSFSDLVRISGLSHGTDVWINNAQYYIKEGFTTLKDCISTRDDIMVYLLHKDLEPKTAFTIMEKVRKGKGLSEEHEKIMKEHDVPDWYIGSCKKIKYMFPKGHAVAYVMMAIRIAYYKVYYPKEYYATFFTIRADDFDANLIVKGDSAIRVKMDELEDLGKDIGVKEKGLLTALELSFEMYKRGIKLLNVDLYKSEAVKFTIEEDSLRPPLNALEGVGENAAKSIVLERVHGEFISKEDLRTRCKVSKTVIEALDNHGCLKDLPDTNQLSFF